MDVSGSAAVVAWEDRLKNSDAVLVGLLETTERDAIKVGTIVSVSVAVVLDARVYACRIAVPYIPIDTLDRLASVDIDELGVHIVDDTRLIIDEILANQLTLNPERSDLSIGREDASGISE
ncbi:hypothetical protein HG530_009247 [Fusarium avenaceum]|nr:hypothetical protein HG530_009247 [Fusarium avenaceum]